MNAKGILTNDNIYTKVGWSPYAGLDYHGKPVMTVVRGMIVMQDGKVVGEPGRGQFIPGGYVQ